MPDFYRLHGKRASDLVLGSIALVLLFPVMLVVAAIVSVTLGRPILFSQRRTGLHGRPFILIKFRTMTRATGNGGALLADASRLTPIGDALRRFSLDELPQLLNVLRGDMSLVGPRPLLPEYLPRYTAAQARRHDVKPGITGLAQVSGRNALSWEEKFELDVRYAQTVSFALDIRILARTLLQAVRGTGARHPGHATMPEFRGPQSAIRNPSPAAGIPRSADRGRRIADRGSRAFNILVSSAGRRVGLQDILREALRDAGLRGEVMAADMSPLSAAFHSADRSFLVPPCDDEGFIPAVLEICEGQGIRLVVPTIDTELPCYAANRDRFAAMGTTVAVSTPEVIAIARDKAMTNGWLRRNGFPVPRQAPLEAVRHDPAGWPLPLVVKPRTGSASAGIVFATRRAQLALLDEARGYVVEERLAGVEYTIDVLAAAGGRCLCAVPRRRMEVRGGEIAKAQTCRIPDLEALACGICETLPGAYGVLNIQVIVGHSGPAVIEINPRFGGGFPLTWEAGGRYPAWMLEEILGRPSTASRDAWTSGVTMLRYDAAVYVGAPQASFRATR
ncbi:MAG: sugar transferase [Vicinamibacterales bacterium]